MKAEELREELKRLGWRIGPGLGHDPGWYAWTSLEGATDCTSNEKPPGLTLIPWEHISPGSDLRQVEFEVTGEVGGREWVKLKLYSVSMDKAIETIPLAASILLAAWNAAALATMSVPTPALRGVQL